MITWVNSKSLSIHEFDLPVTNFKVSSVRPVTEFFVRRQLYNPPTRRCNKISDVPRAGVPSPGVRRDVRRSEQWTLHAQYAYGATFGMEEVYIIYLELRINKIKEKGRNKENNYYWSKIFFDPGQALHPSFLTRDGSRRKISYPSWPTAQVIWPTDLVVLIFILSLKFHFSSHLELLLFLYHEWWLRISRQKCPM